MGYIKKLFINFLNKRNYPLIKMYSFYKKDIWGFMKYKRLFRFKKAIYSIMRKKRKFYYKILYLVYKGVFFNIKRYNYKANLFFVKKRLKLFYGNLKLSYLGKLGLSVKNKKRNIFLTNFFSILERRIDVILYRAFYINQIRLGRRLVCLKYIYINNKLLLNPNIIVYIGDILHINHYPFGFFFLNYLKGKIINNYYKRHFYLILFKNLLKKSNFSKYNRLKYFYNTAFLDYLEDCGYKPNFFFLLQFNKKTFIKFMERFALQKKLIYYYNYYSYINLLKIIKYLGYIKYKFFFIQKGKIKKKRFLKYLRYLPGLSLFRLRFKRFFFLLKPKRKKFLKNFSLIRRAKRLAIVKKYRKWKFSKFVFFFLLKFKNFNFFFFGTPNFFICDYKTHSICLLSNPSILSIKYPFTVRFKYFFFFFKLKSYF